MKKEKLKERVLSVPPKRDISFQELDSFLKSYHFVLCRFGDNAHPLYIHEKYKDLIIGFGKPHGKQTGIKISYLINVRKVIEILDEREGNQT